MQIKLIFIRKWEFLELGNGLSGLERLCLEDIAVLGQFCVEVIT